MQSDPTAHAFSTLPEILADFANPSQGEIPLLRWLLVHRGLHLLRVASREQIEIEYVAIAKFLESGNAAVHTAGPEALAWAFLRDLLGEAAKRSDAAAVNSILADKRGHATSVLEVLAEVGPIVLRSDLRTRLAISESHLSHLLRELEEADLISRYRNGREISIELGATGRAAVGERILPQWLELILAELESVKPSQPHFQIPQLEQRLQQAGIPSKLAAARVVKAFVELEATLTSRPRAEAHPRPSRGTTDAGEGLAGGAGPVKKPLFYETRAA